MSRFNFIIITPSYNQADYLSQTVESVLNQNNLLKYYVMDGGSSDESVAFLKKYSHKKLTWESKQDKGQTDAINKGLKQVLNSKKIPQNTIIAYLNSDDYYLEDTFDNVADLFSKNPDKQWLVGDAEIINEKNQQIQQPIRFYKKIWRMLLSKTTLGILNPIPQPAVFIKLAAVKKTGLFTTELTYVMDYEYWFRLFETVGSPVITTETLAAFRIHGESKGGTSFTSQFQEQYKVAQQFIKNTLVLWLQSVHNLLITSVYRLIK